MQKSLLLDHQVLPMLRDMSNNGMGIDVDYFKRLSNEFQTKAQAISSKIDKIIGYHINPNSTQQIAKALFEIGVFPEPDMMANEKVMSKYREHEVVNLIQEYKHLKDLDDKFARNMHKYVGPDGRIHTNIKATRVVSGRLATSDPNMLGIPSHSEEGNKIRRGFIPYQDYLYLGVDYSQIEMRILAYMSRDTTMMDMFFSGGDIHAMTAERMFGTYDSDKRRVAKSTGFGIVYGISAHGLAEQFSMSGLNYSEAKCQKFISAWYDVFPQVRNYMYEVKAFVVRNKYIEDLSGRRRRLPGIDSPDTKIQEAVIREAVNFTIQSTAAMIIKMAMVELIKYYQESGGLLLPLLQQHDELDFEVHKDCFEECASHIAKTMANSYKLNVPVKTDIEVGYNWGDMQEVEV